MNKKMKKIGLYTMALLCMGLVSCNQDFDTEFVPQTNLPESLLQMSDVSVTATAPATIKLSDYIDEEAGIDKVIPIGTVSVKEGAMPANTILKAEVEFSKSPDFDDSIILDANSLDGSNEISVKASDLQDAYFYNITRNPAETPLYIRTELHTVTAGTAEAIVGKPGENFFAERTVQFTPLKKVVIAQNYYLVGGPNDWQKSAANKTIKFEHSDADVYEDPIFSVVFDASKDGDTWFAIGDDEACEAIGAGADGAWDKLLGIVGGNSEATSGRLDFRYNMGAENSFKVAAGTAKKIKVTINMMDYTFTVQAINVADNYYIVGGLGDWYGTACDKSQKFSHSSASVADDPVFTYVFEGNGGDIWFAIGDDDACDAIKNDNDWSKLYGTTSGNGENGLTGSLARRSALSDDGSFKVDGTSKFVRVQINMATLTYTITPLNFAEYLWEAGVNNNWGTEAQPLYCSDGNGTYVGFFYAQDADWSGGKGAFKFQAEFNNWDVNYGYGTGDDAAGTLGGENFLVDPGFYRAEIDLANLTYKLTKITTIGIIGPAQAGGWSEDTDMTYNSETGAWEATIDLAADEIKFRANDSWDINWGGSVENLTQDGPNLKITEAGKYFVQFFPICETKSYCKITKK